MKHKKLGLSSGGRKATQNNYGLVMGKIHYYSHKIATPLHARDRNHVGGRPFSVIITNEWGECVVLPSSECNK
jgi:hypothetical protein